MSKHANNFPKLHNAMWPGLVGKGSPGAEPCIDLDTMLDLTAKAEVNGVKFDGVDMFLFDPHISIDISDDDLKRLADKIRAKGFVVGSVVAPVWPPTGGGSAMGSDEDRKKFVAAGPQSLPHRAEAARTRRATLRRGAHRFRLPASSDWAKDPEGNTEADRADVPRSVRCRRKISASDSRPKARFAGAACTVGSKMVELLELVDRPKTVGFQADMAHTLLYTLGYNAPEDAHPARRIRIGRTRRKLDEALEELTAALRPWTIDFHVAQNDATVKGSGSHDKTGRHCLANDPNGKLDIPHHAGYWLRDEKGKLTKAIQAHLLGRLHVPERRHDEASRPGTTSWPRWSPCATPMAGATMRQRTELRKPSAKLEVQLSKNRKRPQRRRPAVSPRREETAPRSRAKAKPAKRAKAKKPIAKARCQGNEEARRKRQGANEKAARKEENEK